MSNSLLSILEIAAVIILYPNIGWLFYWLDRNPGKAWIFGKFFKGPDWSRYTSYKPEELSENRIKQFEISCFFIWPIWLLIFLFIWSIEMIIQIKRLVFGGIVKKFVGYK
jgi:hypothetical protein